MPVAQPGSLCACYANRFLILPEMVRDRGFEPLTPSVSRKCSTTELTAHWYGSFFQRLPAETFRTTAAKWPFLGLLASCFVIITQSFVMGGAEDSSSNRRSSAWQKLMNQDLR